VYWKFVDGTTHGPICDYLLLAPAWFGAPFQYVTARAVAVVLQAGALAGVWGTLRCFSSERVARLSVLPALAFWAFASWDEYVHYSSELAGVTLLSLAGWAMAVALTRPRTSRLPALPLYLGGFLLGAVPFAKLQSAPPAAVMAVIAAVLWWIVRRPDSSAGRRGCLWLALGGVTVPGIVLGFLLVYGLVGEFWYSYLVGNLAYVGLGQHPLREMPGWFFQVASVSAGSAWFLSGSIGFALVYARAHAGRPAPVRAGTIVAWLLLGVAYLGVISSGREVPHYLHLLVVPTATLAGFVLAGAIAESTDDSAGSRRRIAPLLLFGLLTLAPQAYTAAIGAPRFRGRISATLTGATADAARFIRQRARPDDTLATWGWEPALYVATGLAQGTREAHTACELTAWPLQEFYLRRYVADLRGRRPAWFVDGVGPGAFMFKDRRYLAHERIAEVNAVIEQDYEFLAEFGPNRIYRIREKTER
jgi:hypothetical protein